jgi:uncharacterized protein (TIGR02117 family)
MRDLLAVALLALHLALSPAAAARTYTIYVSSNGWHTDITVRKADIPADRITEATDFADAHYLQFGWGDADYYTTPDPGIGTTLGAAFAGPAVVHVAGLKALPNAVFNDTEQIALTLSAENFAKLLDALHASFDRGGAARVAASADGVYDFSRFYPATGEFHLFNTCNTWTAQTLAAAGVAVTVSGTQSADDVMRQLRVRTEEQQQVR